MGVENSLMFPQTPAATAALSVATIFIRPRFNHCVRSYLWGTMYGAAHGIVFDDELYYVSALLHDIGLTEAFDSHRLAFEEAGGGLAWVFGVAAGWPADRAARATERSCCTCGTTCPRPSTPKPTCCRSLRAGNGRTAAGAIPAGGEGRDARSLSPAGIWQRVPGML